MLCCSRAALATAVILLTCTASMISTGPKRLPRQLQPGTGKCSAYTIINARGTGEAPFQESKPFVDVNQVIRTRMGGGQTYLVNYPAAITQNSQSGTIDIINKVTTTLAYNPNMCFFLEGYSQGAAAIVNALPQLLPYFDAIRGIAVVGNPKSATGLQSLINLDILFKDPRGRRFRCKTLDICALGDPICGLPSGGTTGLGHLSYTFDIKAHDKVIDFAREALTTGVQACYQPNAMRYHRRDLLGDALDDNAFMMASPLDESADREDDDGEVESEDGEDDDVFIHSEAQAFDDSIMSDPDFESRHLDILQ